MLDRIITLATIAAIAFAAWWAYEWFNSTKKSPVGVSTLLAEAPEIKHEEKTDAVMQKPPKVFKNRNVVMKKLALPSEVVADQNKEVAAASVIPPDGFARGHTISAVVDKESGETKIYDRPDALPWVRFRQDGFVWAGAGLLNGENAARVLVTQHLVSVKSLTISGMASVDQPMGASSIANNHGLNTFVGVGVTIPW